MVKAIKFSDDYVGEVVQDKYNPLIKRRELRIKIAHMGKGTPPRGIVRIGVAKEYDVDVNRVYVRRVLSQYGWGVTIAEVHIYDSPERARLFEPKHILKRNEYALASIQAQSEEQS